MMKKQIEYQNNMNIAFKNTQIMDINRLVAENKHVWLNQTLTQVNDSVVRLGIIEGSYHWHKHEYEDEFFYVVEGTLFIDLEDKTLELNPNQGVTISKNVMHRTRAPQKVVMLMVEAKDIVPAGS